MSILNFIIKYFFNALGFYRALYIHETCGGGAQILMTNAYCGLKFLNHNHNTYHNLENFSLLKSDKSY